MASAANNGKGTNAAAGTEGAPGVTIFGINPKRFLTIPLKRWKGVLAAVALSVVIGFLAGKQLAEESWKCYGTLIFLKASPGQGLATYYTQPDKATIMDENLVLSPQNLDTLATEFDIEVPALKGFKVVPPTNIDSDVYEIDLVWPDPDQGSKLVQRLMKMHVEEMARRRRAVITKFIEDTERNLAAEKKKLDAAKEAYDKFISKHPTIHDPKNDLDTLEKEIVQKQQEIRKQQEDLTGKRSKQKALRNKIEEMNSKKDTDSAAGPELAQAQQQRLQLGRELAAAKINVDNLKRDLADAEWVLESFEKANKIVAGTRSEDDLRQARARINTLKGNVKVAEDSVKSLQDQLAIQKLPTVSNPVLARALQEQLDIEVDVEAAADTLKTSEALLERMRKQTSELLSLKDEFDPLYKAWQLEDKAYTSLENELGQARQAQGSGVSDLRIDTPGTYQQFPSNNRKNVTIKFTLIPLVILLGLVVIIETRSRRWRAETMADQLGLPILARTQTSEQRAASRKKSLFNPQDVAALALRLRQYVPESGAPILFSSVAEGHEVDTLVIELARSYAMRDEKVLLLDARIADAPGAGLSKLISKRVTQAALEVAPPRNDAFAPDIASHVVADRASRVAAVRRAATEEGAAPGSLGLVQYLVFEGQEIGRFIFPTRVPSIDFMPAGGPFNVTDILASEPMKDLFEYLRKTYSLILLVGPALARAVDTEILAAYANGMVILTNEVQYASDSMQFLSALKESDAPLLGCVITV